jgi:chaperone modulatory protein CbpM
MMTIEHVILQVQNLEPQDLERWIAAELVRPDGERGSWRFAEIDVARIRLIVELRDSLEVNEPALPTVLSLLDQLYGLRRQMRRLDAAMEALLAPDLRAALQRHLAG